MSLTVVEGLLLTAWGQGAPPAAARQVRRDPAGGTARLLPLRVWQRQSPLN